MKIIIDSKTFYDSFSDVINTEAACRLQLKNGTWYILYKEPDTETFGSTSTVIKVRAKQVSIIRTGDTESKFIIEEGRINSLSYNTGAGIVDIQIAGQSVNYTLHENGGRILLKYDTMVDAMGLANSIEMKINII